MTGVADNELTACESGENNRERERVKARLILQGSGPLRDGKVWHGPDRGW